ITETFTTEGATCLAIWLNVFDSSTGVGITSGVAPGACPLSLAAFTPELISVPRTMPIDSVNNITVNESNFCVRNLSKKLMVILPAPLLLMMDAAADSVVSLSPAQPRPGSELRPRLTRKSQGSSRQSSYQYRPDHRRALLRPPGFHPANPIDEGRR